MAKSSRHVLHEKYHYGTEFMVKSSLTWNDRKDMHYLLMSFSKEPAHCICNYFLHMFEFLLMLLVINHDFFDSKQFRNLTAAHADSAQMGGVDAFHLLEL